MVQSLLPGRRAFASGLTLGLMFFSGAVGSYLLGVVADEIGLATALQALILLPVVAILGTLLLPRPVVASG
jgi:FSR family fosmidomycin resistance protein-like MFS transporter